MPLFLRPTWPDSNRDTDFVVIFREAVTERLPRELVIGRILWAYAGVPQDRPWQWHVTKFQCGGRAPPYVDYVADFETAKAAWKRCWESGNPPINWPPALRLPDDP